MAPEVIPWQFSSHGQYVQYEWENVGADANDTFHAQIVSQGGQWSWTLEAGLPDNPLWRIGGPAADKATCQEMVCEAIAKAFSPTGAYRHLVEAAGHRYTLADGARVDLRETDGYVVRVVTTSGHTLIGTLRTGGWDLLLVGAGRAYTVRPDAVASIEELDSVPTAPPVPVAPGAVW